MAPTTRTRTSSFGRISAPSLPTFTSPLGPAHLMPPPQQAALLSRKNTNSGSISRRSPSSAASGEHDDRFLGSLYGAVANLDLYNDRPVSGDVDDHKVPKLKRAIDNFRRSTHSNNKHPATEPECARGDHTMPLRALQPNAPNAPSPTPTNSSVPGVRYSVARLPNPAYSYPDSPSPSGDRRSPSVTSVRGSYIPQNRAGSRLSLIPQDYEDDEYDVHQKAARGRRGSVDTGRSKEAELYLALGLQQAEQERRKRETAKARKSFLGHTAPGAVREYWAN